MATQTAAITLAPLGLTPEELAIGRGFTAVTSSAARPALITKIAEAITGAVAT